MDEKIYILPEFPIEKVACVYVGKPDCCMCGCSGTYTRTKVNQQWSSANRGYEVTDDECDDKKVMRVINKVRKNQSLGIEVIGDHIYTIVIGQTQYSIYLVE